MNTSELVETNQARITFENSGADIKRGSSLASSNVDDKNVQPTPGYTLGRYTLHSPVPPESARGEFPTMSGLPWLTFSIRSGS